MPLSKKIFIAGLAISAMMLFRGCDKYWEEHYHTLDKTSEKDKIIAEMEKIPEISEFTEAIKQVDSLSELLVQNRLFTVFAPSNAAFETIDPAIMNNDVLRNRMLMYHFIDGKYKYKDLVSGQVMTFANKLMSISVNGSEGGVKLDNSASIIDPDYLALNGMIQVIDKPLKPLNNLYEYYVFNDYVNDFADAINSYTVKEFDLEASTPVAKNEDGEIIYDSVFIVTNPFLYTGNDLIWENLYGKTFRYINIANENQKYTFAAPTNFADAVDEVMQSPFLNNPIDKNSLAGPLLVNLVMDSYYTKDELIAEIDRINSLPDQEPSPILTYYSNLLTNNYAGAVPLSNGIVHEVNGFSFDLGWLIMDEGNVGWDQTERNYRTMLHASASFSEGVDTVDINSNNIRGVFLSGTDTLGYTAKYGEWVSFHIEGDFYPVDYKVYVRGRNNSSGTFRVEIEGQVISDYNFAEAPSGDLDTEFDEIGTVSFDELKSSTDLKFTFIQTHPGDNTNEQYLWVRELKLSPILE